MSETPNLRLPCLLPSQAQKHVTVNDALCRLDAIVQLGVESRTADLPPAAAAGQRWIVPPQDATRTPGHVAAWIDDAWVEFAPARGWIAHIADEARLLVHDGLGWTEPPAARRTDRLGVSTDADETNRLAVASPASLFSHAGDSHRLIINRNAPADTASLILQTGWSGRMELGLVGDDVTRLKTSPDGQAWKTAFEADSGSGRVRFPQGCETPLAGTNLLANPGFTVNQRQFAGPNLSANTYGHDRWRAGPAGCTYAVAGRSLTLASGALRQSVPVELAAGEALVFSAEIAGAALDITLLGHTIRLEPSPFRQSAVWVNAGPDVSSVVLELAGTGASLQCPKLETGVIPTPWSARHPAEELALCRFFYEQIGPGPGGYNPIAVVSAVNPTLVSGYVAHAAKRVTPQVTFSGQYQVLGMSLNNNDISSLTAFTQSPVGFELRLVPNRSISAGLCGLVRTYNDPSAVVIIDADLS